MSVLRYAGLALALALVTGCATTSDNDDLTTSADTLAMKTHSFAQATENAPGQGPAADYAYARDVHALADQAEQFRQMLGRRADNGDLRSAFDSLSQTYLTVNGEVDRSHSEWTQQSWRSVHAAYADLQRQMSGYG